MRAAPPQHRFAALLAVATLALLVAFVGFPSQPGARAQNSPTSCEAVTVPLAAGFNLVAVLDAATPATLVPSAGAVFGWDADQQQYDSWRPDLPLAFNTLTTLGAGTAVWIFLDDGPSSSTLPTAPQAARLAPMAPGWNLATWTGPNATNIGDAFSPQAFGAQTIVQSPFTAAMTFDNQAQRFKTFDTRLPDVLNDLTHLNFGDAVWLHLAAGLDWSIPAASSCAGVGDTGTTTEGSNSEACSEERPPFEDPPVELDAIELVVPLGLMSDSHVTPVDHQYFQNYKDPERVIEVYSPAAGTVTEVQHMSQSISDQPRAPIDDYRIVIEHGCGLSSIFIHVGQLAPALAAVAPPPGEYTGVAVTVAAGEQIGSFQGNVDYNVVDAAVTLAGLLVPEHYAAEPWKVHAPNSFPYFSDAIEKQLIAKSLRTAEPVGGRFDYDIEGRLVGNWFEEGTNGYAGVDQERYWAGHLAVAYNHLDPSLIMISMGTFDGRSAQFAVRGNAPDPEEVSLASGPLAYELVPYDYWAGADRWDRVSLVRGIEARAMDGPVHGVVLFELLAPRQLMVEVFVGGTAAEVEGFTGSALIYER